MAAVKDRLMQLEQAYSFLRDPEIGMAIDTVKVMEARIEILEDTLRDVLTYYVQTSAISAMPNRAIDNAWKVLEEGLL